MAKELMGTVVTKGKIEATYRYNIMGATKTDRKEKDWPAGVREAADQLLNVAQTLAGDVGKVQSVQLYTAATDPEGTAYSGPGELVDIAFMPGASPASVRIGDDEAVPAELAQAREAFKSAVAAAL
jgi:hypothetical protein